MNDKDMFIDISISADSNAINHANYPRRVDHSSSAFFFSLTEQKVTNKKIAEVFHNPCVSHYIHCWGFALTGHYRVEKQSLKLIPWTINDTGRLLLVHHPGTCHVI